LEKSELAPRVGVLMQPWQEASRQAHTEVLRCSADDSLLAMLTNSKKLEQAATPRNKEPMSATPAHAGNVTAKAGGPIDWYRPPPVHLRPALSLLSGIITSHSYRCT